MELEKVFTKNYRKISLNFTDEQANVRLEGINQASEQFNDIDASVDLIKIYYKMECYKEVKTKFIDCFYSTDKTFDEENEEEISVLAGCVLYKLIQDNADIWLAYSVYILDNFFERKVEELSGLACETIITLTKDVKKVSPCEKFTWKKDWEKELVDEVGKAVSTTPQATVDMLKNVRATINKVINYSNSLLEENKKCEEKINVLSWIIGEWSNFLQKPLEEIEDTEGAVVIGMELAELVSMPGPFAADSFLVKMLEHCKSTGTEISLTDLVDGQEEVVKKHIVEKFGEEAKEINLPIISAIEYSLSVDDKGAWVSAYRKAWKINPDTIKLSWKDWSKLVYLECMLSK